MVAGHVVTKSLSFGPLSTIPLSPQLHQLKTSLSLCCFTHQLLIMLEQLLLDKNVNNAEIIRIFFLPTTLLDML